jgi:crotonobetainyl-CoA:carnitine CoA-transferase CaiB-like acyl-CoA transferase
MTALTGISVVDISGSISTAYCAKLFADYGADVINIEPVEGFPTRREAPFITGLAQPEASATHGYLNARKRSVVGEQLSSAALADLIADADVVLDDGSESALLTHCNGVRSSITWFGKNGPYASFKGTDAMCFALNGMLRGFGPVEGPPLIPSGYQAQIVGGNTAFIASMTQVLAAELGNRTAPLEIETSIFESCLCFTEVGVVGVYNTGIQAPRMGINRFPPTYPLGVFPCEDGWIGLTVLTPSQWHTFCDLLDLQDYADVPLFQSSIGRLQAIDVLEPMITEKLLTFSAEDLFYRAQRAAVPLARVPTMEELLSVDQYVQRDAFADISFRTKDGGIKSIKAPTIPFRLFETPPEFGGHVAGLGEHNGEYAS